MAKSGFPVPGLELIPIPGIEFGRRKARIPGLASQIRILLEKMYVYLSAYVMDPAWRADWLLLLFSFS